MKITIIPAVLILILCMNFFGCVKKDSSSSSSSSSSSTTDDDSDSDDASNSDLEQLAISSGGEVVENAADDAVVAVLATDDSSLDINDFTLDSIEGDADGAFVISGNNIVIEDSSLLDYATSNSLEVTVNYTDSNGVSGSDDLTITVLPSFEGDWQYCFELGGTGGTIYIKITDIFSGSDLTEKLEVFASGVGSNHSSCDSSSLIQKKEEVYTIVNQGAYEDAFNAIGSPFKVKLTTQESTLTFYNGGAAMLGGDFDSDADCEQGFDYVNLADDDEVDMTSVADCDDGMYSDVGDEYFTFFDLDMSGSPWVLGKGEDGGSNDGSTENKRPINLFEEDMDGSPGNGTIISIEKQ